MSSAPTTASEPARRVRRVQAPTPRVVLLIATAIVVGILFYLGRSVLTPFLVGALLVYVLDPAVDWVARIRIAGRQIPRGLAVLLVYVVVFIVIVEGLTLLVGPLVRQLLEYISDLPRISAALESVGRQLAEIYRGLELPAFVRDAVDGALEDLGRGAGSFDFGSVLPIARSVAGTAAAIFGYLIVPVWAFYILKDRPSLTARFDEALPPSWRQDVWAVLGIIERVFGRWLRGQLLLGVVVGVATFAGLMLLGYVVDPRFHQFAVFLAVVAGILELLPIIGPIISMIPTLLVALTAANPAQAALAVLILYLVVQQLENNVLVPMIQGGAIELHPSVVIFALILGGAIAGLMGAIFALPIAAAGRDVYRYLFRRLSDDDPAIPPPPEDTPTPPVPEGPAANTAPAAVAADAVPPDGDRGPVDAEEAAPESSPPAERS